MVPPLGVKWPKFQADHTSSFHIKVKNVSFISTPQYIFMTWRLGRIKFNFICRYLEPAYQPGYLCNTNNLKCPDLKPASYLMF